MVMQPRLNPYQAAPEAMKALTELEKYVRNSGIEPSLIELVKTRASQIQWVRLLHLHAHP
jgi:alkylhydroperoxidase family enzyme